MDVSPRSWHSTLRTWLVVLGLLILIAPFVIPFLWMVLGSFRADHEIFQYVFPLQWHTFVPVKFTLANYMDVIVTHRLGRYFFNTALVSIAVVALGVIVNSFAAYAFARLQFRGREWLFIVVLSTIFIPFEATVLPLYLVVQNLGLENTYTALVIPWVASPFGIFLLRQFFQEIPKELDEAATVDGCSPFQIYALILLPLIKPALITLGLLQFLWAWDQFFWPLVIMSSPEKQVIQVAISSLTTRELTFWGQTLAASTLTALPVILLFLILQRYYVRGITHSGLKS